MDCASKTNTKLVQVAYEVARASLVDLEAVQSLMPEKLRSDAEADLRVNQAAQIHFASSANQTEFILAREKLLPAKDPAEQQALGHELIGMLDREIDLARRLYSLAVVDSRLGYEASNQYYYVPLDLVEKVINCVQLHEHYAANK